MSIKVSTSAPDALVVFYPFKVEDTTSDSVSDEPSDFMQTAPLIVQDDLLSVSTGKSKGGVGSFTITLSSNQAYKSKINPGCWVLIYINSQQIDKADGSSVSSGLKMLGIVRSVRRFEQTDYNGKRIVRYQVGGEDFQSVFNTPVYLNAQLSGDANPIAITIATDTADKKTQGQFLTADNVISILIENLLGPVVTTITDNKKVSTAVSNALAGGRGKPYLVPSEVTQRLFGADSPDEYFTSMMTFFLQEKLPGECIPIPQIGGTTPIWGILKSFANEITNEMYTDLLPVTINHNLVLAPSFVLRAIPFSTRAAPDESCIKFVEVGSTQDVPENGNVIVPVGSGDATNFYVSKYISESEIFSFSSGKSDAERFNFFFVIPNVINGSAPAEGVMAGDIISDKGGFSALADTASLQRYGLRPFVAYSQYFINNQIWLPSKISEDIWDRAQLFESGQVTIIGSREHIPVGTNIIFSERKWMAHVERVDHDFSVNFEGMKVFRTTISFSRLQTIDGKPVDLTEDFVDGDTKTGQQGSWDRGISRGGTK